MDSTGTVRWAALQPRPSPVVQQGPQGLERISDGRGMDTPNRQPLPRPSSPSLSTSPKAKTENHVPSRAPSCADLEGHKPELDIEEQDRDEDVLDFEASPSGVRPLLRTPARAGGRPEASK